MPSKPERESALEARCVAKVEVAGGMALKLRPLVGRGWPDRTCLLRGRVFFLETKRVKLGVVAAAQHKWRVLLTQMGFKVYTINNDAAFDAALKEWL